LFRSAVGNVVEASRLADLAVGSLEDVSALGNCFADNTFSTSAPQEVETLAPCEGEGRGDWSAGALDLVALIAAEHPPSGDYKTTPVPEPQENMPDAETAPARPAGGPPPAIDLDALAVPARPWRRAARSPGRRWPPPWPSWPGAAAPVATATPRSAVPPPGRCGCRPPTPGRRGGCRSSSSSAPSATRRPTTRSCTPGTAAGRTSTCSSATRRRT